MAAEPHRPGQGSPHGPPVFEPVVASGQEPPSTHAPSFARGLVPASGPVRGLTCHSVVPGWVTCVVEGAEVIGSAGKPVRADAMATAPSADEARQLAWALAMARHAAGFWDADAFTKHPPQPPHGTGPGPWVRMWVGDAQQREVWMPAARVYAPFRLANGRVVGDLQGLACADGLAAARSAAQHQQITRRAMLPLWQALARQPRASSSAQPADGVCDRIVCHAHGLSLAVSFQWSRSGPLFGVAGVGCGVNDDKALAHARRDRAHTEALLRLQQAGVWGGPPEACPPGLDDHVHRLAWHPDEAMAMAALVSRWRARAQPTGGAAQRSALAWSDLTPPSLRDAGLWVVRALWLDGEGSGLSQPRPLSPRH